MTDVSGPMLFLYYAWVCAKYLLVAKKISQKDYDEMKWWVENKIKPDVSVLERCFLKAVEKMDTFRKSTGFVCDRWDRYIVEKYWRHHHEGVGDCAVRLVAVFEIDKNLVKVGLDKPVTNFYQIPLKVGDLVFIHLNTVIEKLESATAR